LFPAGPRHHECLSCRAYIRKSMPQNSFGPAKQKYQDSLRTDDTLYEEHMTGIVLIESDRSSRGFAQVRRRQLGDAIVEDDAPAKKICKVGGRELELRRCVGILWPLKDFEQLRGRKAKPSEITKIEQNGELLTGVILDRSTGMPPGGTEIFERNTVGMTSAALLHDSRKVLREGETKDVEKFAMGRVKVNAAMVEDKDTKETHVKVKGMDAKRKKDLFGLDEIWDMTSISLSTASQGDIVGIQNQPNLQYYVVGAGGCIIYASGRRWLWLCHAMLNLFA